MRSGSVLRGGEPSISRTAAIAVLGLALLAVPSSVAHGLISLDLEVPADCPGEGACLQTRENQPRLHAGETVDVNVYNDDTEREHRLHVAVNASVEPGANTSTDVALLSTDRIEPGGARVAGELAIPTDAEALYVWCSLDDHEAAGEALLVPLEPAHDDEEQDEAPLPGGLLLLVVGVAAGARGRT